MNQSWLKSVRLLRILHTTSRGERVRQNILYTMFVTNSIPLCHLQAINSILSIWLAIKTGYIIIASYFKFVF